jgi:methionyl-tRNA formyltransferase
MSKKIVFMGTPEFSVKTLIALSNSKFDVTCVYSQPPNKSARGQKIKISPVHEEANKLNLLVRTPNTMDDESEFKFFKSLKPYIVVVVAFGKIIPKRYLDIPEKGFINIHASLLPKWRGAAPIHRSIMNSEKETGISIMRIEEGLDTGPYMKQVKVKIDEETNTKILSNKLSILGSETILDCINLIKKDEARFVAQKIEKVTYAKKISKAEAKINWQLTAKEIIAKVNGLNPSPGAWFERKGSRYKIWKATLSNLKGMPGEVINKNLIIGCLDQSIQIL